MCIIDKIQVTYDNVYVRVFSRVYVGVNRGVYVKETVLAAACTMVPHAANRTVVHKTRLAAGCVVALSVRVVKDPFSMLAMLASMCTGAMIARCSSCCHQRL